MYDKHVQQTAVNCINFYAAHTKLFAGSAVSDSRFYIFVLVVSTYVYVLEYYLFI